MGDDDGDEELGDLGDQLNGIADRFDDPEETSETAETTKMSETTTTTGSTETSDTTETTETPGPEDEGFQLREDWNGRTIYLPDDVVDDLDVRYQEMNLEWMQVHGEELPKNERFYPAVVRSALNETSIETELGLDD